MTEPYLFERGIGQQMGDLCRLAVGDAKVTQTGEIVTLEDMLARGAFGVSVEVPYASGGVQSVSVTRCGKNLLNIFDRVDGTYEPNAGQTLSETPVGNASLSLIEGGVEISTAAWRWYGMRTAFLPKGSFTVRIHGKNYPTPGIRGSINITNSSNITQAGGIRISDYGGTSLNYTETKQISEPKQRIWVSLTTSFGSPFTLTELEVVRDGVTPSFEPYNGNTYAITLPADFYGGTVNLEACTVTSRYAADGTELAEPVASDIDPVAIPILAGVNNIWADVGTVTVSYYRADAETFRPALWYPTIYRGLTSARYLIKSASGAVASFDDAVAAPLVGLRVALPWRSEGYDAVEVTVNGTATAITLPATIYGGYLDVVTGQLVATHDANGNLLANQKLYFLPPVNINAIAGSNNVWSDAGDVAVSYRVEQ